jgi:nitrogen-specific signal transduction histidine kinase
MNNPNTFTPPKHEHRLLGLMLITWHIALWGDYSTPLLHVILLIHLSLFFLWQPFWNRLEPHPIKNKIILGTLILFFYTNAWTMSLWQITLLGIMGGRALVKPRDRIINIAAILFLSLDLFLINLQQLFIIEDLGLLYQFAPEIRLLLNYGLLCLPLTFLFISAEQSPEHRHNTDFYHGLTTAMLIIIMALGSLIIISQSNVSLPLAIFQMSLAMTIFILTIADKKSVEQLWTRHLHNMADTFEQWINDLAQPRNYKSLTPQEFLLAGFEQLSTLPWISGIAWHSLYDQEMLGERQQQQLTITAQSLDVTIYAQHRINGSQYFQIKTLIQLLEHFHQARRREAAFAQQAHLQAIHETGAKLTHDIKNLLQSLHAITSVIETSQPNKFGDTQRLLQGQMPHLTQRLKRTLDKLQKPAEFSYSHIPVRLWWDNLKARYRKSNIEFSDNLTEKNILIPEDLFDNVSENILQNALTKRKRESDLQIDVLLHITKRRLQLTVCDNGSPIADEIADQLLTQPVPSRDGFGIGLYQAAKQLAHTGYELKIIENVKGQVCFELASTE